MSSKKLISGVLIGAAAGAVLGILFAPGKGTETRRKISKKGSDVAGDLKSKFNEFVDSVTENYYEAKSETAQLFENGKQKASAMKAEINKSLS
ncbi:MAG TPA: YtxH domain-containing protein [Panacibacter sp.]|nr:YtxH domain-containing protein [Panacibacter sp.]